MWGIQATTCVSIIASCEISSFDMLGGCKCTLSTFKIDEDGV